MACSDWLRAFESSPPLFKIYITACVGVPYQRWHLPFTIEMGNLDLIKIDQYFQHLVLNSTTKLKLHLLI